MIAKCSEAGYYAMGNGSGHLDEKYKLWLIQNANSLPKIPDKDVQPYDPSMGLAGLGDLLRYTHATAIVGDILKMRAKDIGLGDMAIVEIGDGEHSLAQVIQLEG